MVQAYICGTGAALLAVNAGVIYRRWKSASQLTHVVAELLGVLGVPLKRQVIIKVSLSAIAGACLLVDLLFAPYFSRDKVLSSSNSSWYISTQGHEIVIQFLSFLRVSRRTTYKLTERMFKWMKFRFRHPVVI